MLRRKFARIHVWTSVGGIVLFVGLLKVFQWTLKSLEKSDPQLFKVVHMATSGGFAATFVMQVSQVIGEILEFSRWSSAPEVEDAQRASLLCTINTGHLVTISINAISAAAHLLMATGSWPAVRGATGRRYHAARWAEWIATVPLIMILLHTYDGPARHPNKTKTFGDARGQHRNVVAAILAKSYNFSTGRVRTMLDGSGLEERAVTSIACQTLAVALGGSAALYPIPRWVAVCMICMAIVLYCNVFYVLTDMYSRCKRLAKIYDEHASTTVDGTNERGSFVSYVALYEQYNRSTRAVTLIVVCCVLWSLIVATFLLGVAGLYSRLAEGIMYAILDILSKCVYASVVGDSAGHMRARESALSTLLALERLATSQRRRFLRCVCVLPRPHVRRAGTSCMKCVSL